MRVRSKTKRRSGRTPKRRTPRRRAKRRLRGGAPPPEDAQGRSAKRQKHIPEEKENDQGADAELVRVSEVQTTDPFAAIAAMGAAVIRKRKHDEIARVRDAPVYTLDAMEIRRCALDASRSGPFLMSASTYSTKLNEFVNRDVALVNAIMNSDHYKLASWQFLHVYNMCVVLCSFYTGKKDLTPEENASILWRYFDPAARRSESVLQFYSALQVMRGVSGEVRQRMSEIINYVHQVRMSRVYIPHRISATTDFARHRGDVPFFQAAAEILWTLLDQDTDVMACLQQVPAIQELFERDALRLAEKRAEQERRYAQSPTLFPDTHFIVNQMHGAIRLTGDRVHTFQVPEDMVVWVVMASTPGNYNFSPLSNLPLFTRGFTRGVRPWELVDTVQLILAEDKRVLRQFFKNRTDKGPSLGLFTTEKRFENRMNYTNLAMKPRVMCLTSGDTYINKELQVSYTDKDFTAEYRRWNCNHELEISTISPPLCEGTESVECAMSDLVQAAKTRGARQLVICDLSCGNFHRVDSPLSWSLTAQAGLRLLGLPVDWARTSSCLSLVQAELAGGARTTL